MSIEERLQAEKKQVKIICDYLMELCKSDENLVRAINEKEKNSVSGMFKYIKDKAQKEAEDGCAMIEDSKVYEWAREYWLDYEETETKTVDSEETVEHFNPCAKAWERHEKEEKKKAQKEAINKLYEVGDLFGGDF